MKKIVSVILLVVMVVTLCFGLVGCGNPDDGKIHIRFYHIIGALQFTKSVAIATWQACILIKYTIRLMLNLFTLHCTKTAMFCQTFFSKTLSKNSLEIKDISTNCVYKDFDKVYTPICTKKFFILDIIIQ